MATITQQRTLHGNHGILRFDGIEVGRITGLSCNTDSGADYVYEVGKFDPVEINHNKGSYRITINTMVLREGALTQLQRFPVPLGDVQAFEISFEDRENGTEFVIYGVEPTAIQTAINTNTRVTQNVTTMALGIRAGDGNRGEGQAYEGAPMPYSSLSDNFGVVGNLPRNLNV